MPILSRLQRGFGHIGGRIGRQRTLMLSMMRITLATALLSDYSAIGSAAGGLLLLLRCFMAFSVDGELRIAIGAIVLACVADRVSAVGAPATAEQFPVKPGSADSRSA